MVSRVVAAAEGCPELDPVCVVGPGEALRPVLTNGRCIVIEPGASLVENIRRGAAAIGENSWMLILTSDIPLIDKNTLQSLLNSCDRNSAKFFYPIIRREVYERAFPGSRRTYARLADGSFTGGNGFLIHVDALEPVLQMVDKIYALRKSPVRLAKLLGVKFVVKLLLGRLRIEELERHASTLIGVSGKAVVVEHPELGFDVDRPEDVALVERYLTQAEGDYGPSPA